MKLKSENQKNRTMSGCGDLTMPERYCTGSKNGHEIQQGELSSLAGVPKREHPSGSADIGSAIPAGTGKQGDT